jgi:hypothetical protein
MSDIDPEKLEEAIKAALDRAAYGTQSNAPYASGPNAQQHLMLACAAGAHLATLPRYKEVEVESWVIVDSKGAIGAFLYNTQSQALCSGHMRVDHSVVRLTGTAKVKVAP